MSSANFLSHACWSQIEAAVVLVSVIPRFAVWWSSEISVKTHLRLLSASDTAIDFSFLYGRKRHLFRSVLVIMTHTNEGNGDDMSRSLPCRIQHCLFVMLFIWLSACQLCTAVRRRLDSLLPKHVRGPISTDSGPPGTDAMGIIPGLWFVERGRQRLQRNKKHPFVILSKTNNK